MQQQVWRFMGFVSAVIGLLCYSLSSSFNHLFGSWNSLKIFLYLCFSFIICFITLFAKLWQFSSSVLFKARLSVLVLIATSVYSFFYDKAMNAKPDAYILISCVAFAVMSFSLSKQTHFGFEVDLLYFFLGCIILQLMKINLLLAFVGSGFSYFLTILRSSSLLEFSELQDQDHLVIQVDSSIDDALIMSQFMACISKLKNQNEFIVPRVQRHVNLFQAKEFLIRNNLLIDSLPLEIISDLQETVKVMVAAGFEKECCHIYSSCCRGLLEECLRLEELDLKEEEKVLDIMMQRWMNACYVALGILFPSERKLCQRVFFGVSPAADLSVMVVCWEFTIGLLNYANDLATGSCSSNHLRCSLRVFHTLPGLISMFDSVFSNHHSASLKNEAIEIRKRLGEAIRVIFMEMENHIFHDMVPKVIPHDRIDLVTYLVENCFNIVLEYTDTLEQIFKDYPIPMVGDREGTSSILSIQMDRIMELLQNNLEAKSKNYTDPAFGYVFLMNNYNYILHMATCGLETNLGSDWIKKHTTKLQQNLEHYQRTWDKVLDILKLDSNESMTPLAATESMKENLRLFNQKFKQICSIQTTWFVFNEQLREEIKISIGKMLLAAYENFIGRFQTLVGKDAYEYNEYVMFDIEALLNNLFLGKQNG
ncbi:hypothetical protein Lal_00024704 [Lupinus albus]|uniref:Exocyst subunit Exo70 family protein n=1 Tax=Lupinus albus TaxID=3870 RepID=A0A6A4PXL2_LUPAL|nr:putative exocyst complex component Exo70, cullin repeat-like-containing domain-containing protein [Lupinus albus]KAF1889379.1 hypothetical protein Lal_00024704 [Lupinus albus]